MNAATFIPTVIAGYATDAPLHHLREASPEAVLDHLTKLYGFCCRRQERNTSVTHAAIRHTVAAMLDILPDLLERYGAKNDILQTVGIITWNYLIVCPGQYPDGVSVELPFLNRDLKITHRLYERCGLTANYAVDCGLWALYATTAQYTQWATHQPAALLSWVAEIRMMIPKVADLRVEIDGQNLNILRYFFLDDGKVL